LFFSFIKPTPTNIGSIKRFDFVADGIRTEKRNGASRVGKKEWEIKKSNHFFKIT